MVAHDEDDRRDDRNRGEAEVLTDTERTPSGVERVVRGALSRRSETAMRKRCGRAAVFGFTGIAAGVAWLAKIAFYRFIVLAVLAVVGGLAFGRTRW